MRAERAAPGRGSATRAEPRERGFSLVEMLTVSAVLGVLLVVIGVMTERVQRSYDAQRQQIEATDNARAAADTLVRLLRQAGNNPRSISGLRAVDPDPDGNGVSDSVAIQADWNPANGALSEPYENTTFFVSGGNLMKREAGDPPEGVEFAPGVQSLAFEYFDTRMAPIPHPSAAVGSIAYVALRLRVQGPGASGAPPVEIASGAALRMRE